MGVLSVEFLAKYWIRLALWVWEEQQRIPFGNDKGEAGVGALGLGSGLGLGFPGFEVLRF